MAAKVLKVHKAYPKPCCPYCGRIFKPAQLHSGEMLCTSCQNTFQAAVFTLPPEIVTVRNFGAHTGAAEGGVAADEAPCAKHPLNAAEGICERCGTFICALCRIELGGKAFCPACFERILQTGTEEFGPASSAYDRGVGRICATLGLIPLVGLLVGPFSMFYSIKAFRQWRAGNPAAGGIGGLIMILLLGAFDTAYNLAGAIWFAYYMYKKI